MTKRKKDPTICKKCGYNMSRSRCKVVKEDWVVRCNSCKTVYKITFKFPEDKESK